MRIAHGTYAGNGTSQTVTVGFQPRVLIIKGGANHTVFWTDQMASDSVAYLAAVLANLTSATVTNVTASGFDVGSDVRVNASATAYYWLAIGGSTAEVATFSYTGNATDNTDISISVATPVFALVKRDGVSSGNFRTTAHGTNESSPCNAAIITTGIKSFGSSAFRVGTSLNANASGSTYHGFALPAQSGFFTGFTWTGTGSSNPLTGFGFAPGWALGKGSSGAEGVLRSTESAAGYRITNAGSLANSIDSLDADGITLGTNTNLNNSGTVGHGFAFKTLSSTAVPVIMHHLREQGIS